MKKLNLNFTVKHKPTEIEMRVLGERIAEWCREFCLELQESQLVEKDD